MSAATPLQGPPISGGIDSERSLDTCFPLIFPQILYIRAITVTGLTSYGLLAESVFGRQIVFARLHLEGQEPCSSICLKRMASMSKRIKGSFSQVQSRKTIRPSSASNFRRQNGFLDTKPCDIRQFHDLVTWDFVEEPIFTLTQIIQSIGIITLKEEIPSLA